MRTKDRFRVLRGEVGVGICKLLFGSDVKLGVRKALHNTQKWVYFHEPRLALPQRSGFMVLYRA